MNKDSIEENKAIQDGLERFLDEELAGVRKEQVSPNRTIIYNEEPKEKELKTEFATEVTPKRQASYERRSAGGYTAAAGQPEHRNSVGERQMSHAADTASRRRTSEETDRYRNTDREASAHRRQETVSDRRSIAPEKKHRGYEPPVSENRKKQHKKSNRKADKRQKKKENDGKKKDRLSKPKKILLIIGIVILAFFLWWYLTMGRIYHKMNYEKSDELASGSLKEQGVINVLLIGNDSRENGEDGRSDAMILISISNKTKTIHMTSLLRDMYVDIPGHDSNRLNAAYAYGGPALLCETIKQNLDIEVNRYVLVNFQAFASLVDAVGGVDLEVTNEEVQWINAYLNEYNLLEGKEMTTDYLDTSLSGEIHLNGPQALAYSRNRYIGTDFGRTERQRKVLSAVMKKLPLAMATNSGELIDGLFPNLTTNLTQTEMYSLSTQASKLLTYDVVQSTVPAEGTYSNATIRKMAVLQVDFEANKKLLKQEIYGQEEQ